MAENVGAGGCGEDRRIGAKANRRISSGTDRETEKRDRSTNDQNRLTER